MGYLDFGMRKEDYTSKPKKPYAYLKKLYGDQLEKHLSSHHVQAVNGFQLSRGEWETFKHELMERIKQENRKRIWRGFLSSMVTITTFFALVWLGREWFGL